MIKKACVESTKSGINPKTAKSSAQNIMLHPHLYFKYQLSVNLQTSLWHASIYNCFCTVDFSSDNKILTQLISIEQQLDKLYVNTESEILEGGEEVRFLATVSDLADRELVITISWAKQVPGNA